jgi:hypothetical protein
MDFFMDGHISRLLKNVMSAGKTRQNPTKKRSLCVINEHFKEDYNAVRPFRAYHFLLVDGFVKARDTACKARGMKRTYDTLTDEG